MTCQNCHEHEATVVITKIVGEQHSITHLCKTCANELGGADGVAINIQNLTTGSEQVGACETCGKTFSEFKQSGLFGCAECYTQFEPYLAKLFKRVQGVTAHVSPELRLPNDDVTSLEAELTDAVLSEDFERAATIRDRLVVLKGGAKP